MSADIRSFFTKKKVQKPSAIIDDDDDVIPESPDVQIKSKKSRRKRVLNDDSDEETFSSKKKKSSETKQSPQKKKITPQKTNLKEVKISDIFGSTPIKRTEPSVKKHKTNTEINIHDDEDFDKSLLELDECETLTQANKKYSIETNTDVTEIISNTTDLKKEKIPTVKKINGKSNSSTNGECSPVKEDDLQFKNEMKSETNTVLKTEVDSFKINKNTKEIKSNTIPPKKDEIDTTINGIIKNDRNDNLATSTIKIKKDLLKPSTSEVDSSLKEASLKLKNVHKSKIDTPKKRSFAEFIEDDINTTNGFNGNEKRKLNKNHVIKNNIIENGENRLKEKGKSIENHDRKDKIRKMNDIDVKPCDKKNISSDTSPVIRSDEVLMWVEKYKPQNVKQIIGQQGDASNVKKLTNWLQKWYVNRKAKIPKPSPWAKNDDGAYYKAVLLSGPPGVGKTTTVTLVCKELGFDTVEFNASDTRNKTLIREQIGELLTTTSLSGYAKGDTSKQAVTKKHVLVMDEVDGMAGNEDRGGLQELIGLIKSTSVPIICMCNDRNSQKMRSLVNYCYDLRFSRPRVNQIKSAMMSICFKEGVKIPPEALSQLIEAANHDIRQTLNLLSMWAVDPERADAETLKRNANITIKDVKLGPWDAVRKVFSEEEQKKMSINDKSDLFFYDYSLAPLFVYENYLQVSPHCPKHEVLQRVSKAADSISIGDLVDARIRGSQAWNLLPLQAMYSSVIPGHQMSGHMTGQIQFPSWLGKNSRANKIQRLGQEIHAHTRLSTSGSKSSIFLDYATYLRDAIVNPLIKDKSDGVAKSLEILESYHLLREDLDSLTELSLWPGQRNPMILVDSAVKAAMTRAYNKNAPALPYAPGPVKRANTRPDDSYDADDPETAEEEPEDSDPENDALIKKKKVKETKKPENSKEQPGTSKEKTKNAKNKQKKK